MGEGFISVQGVTRRFVKDSQVIEVLRGIDLDVQRGEAVSIAGASGVGKSTLIHIMGTLDRPTTGRVLYEGEDVFRWDERGLSRFRNRTIGFVFQFHHLLPELTALENTMMPALISGMSRPQAVIAAQEVLGQVGLSHRLRHKPGELSGGEQQRVAIARALVLKPPVLLADEPTGNLDRRTGEGVEDLLLKMQRELRATLVVVTHNPGLAQKMDRRMELVDGRFTQRNERATQGGETG
ncbi:MAG: ABC transporter ATP-binding protein [Thermodesulfobacteriota bacterium]